MITRQCRVCGAYHQVFMQEFRDKTKHMLLICGKRKVYIPREEIEVPLIQTGFQRKQERRAEYEKLNSSLF